MLCVGSAILIADECFAIAMHWYRQTKALEARERARVETPD